MNYSSKIVVSWVVISILSLGLMPISSALGLDSNRYATGCEQALSDSMDIDLNAGSEASGLPGCQDSSVCAKHYGCAPLQSSTVPVVIALALVHRINTIGDASVSTRVLGVPERPPKA